MKKTKIGPETKRVPVGDLAIRVLAMPANTNPNGDIFGGWVLSNMDLAGALEARKYTSNRVVTVAVDSMSFIAPVHVGDAVCCYAKMIAVGNTSIKIAIETWASHKANTRHIVTEGVFTYVAIDANGRPTKL